MSKAVSDTACRFMLAWIGRCGKGAENGYCAEHRAVKCECGAQATRECPAACSLVCGCPMCDDCTHCKYSHRVGRVTTP